jgi:hypothetical protein
LIQDVMRWFVRQAMHFAGRDLSKHQNAKRTMLGIDNNGDLFWKLDGTGYYFRTPQPARENKQSAQ